MPNSTKIVFESDASQPLGDLGKINEAVKASEKVTMSWTEFLKGKMGPAMKAAMAEGLSHAEAHKRAINEISAQWKLYKASGVDANQAVASSMAHAVNSLSAIEASFLKGQNTTLEWERSAKEANNAVAASFAASSNSVAVSAEKTNAWIGKIKDSWMELASIYLSSRWFVQGADDALTAEKAFNQLRIQIEGMGISYRSVASEVERAIAASSRYATMQDEDVAKVLQELQFHSSQYEGSLKNLNLTLDLAYQKHVSNSEAALLVGKAMAGNIEMFGRIIPELRNLDEKLGKNATEAQKVAFAMTVLEEKANGARSQMTEHEKTIERASKAYNDLKQAVGGVLLDMGVSTVLIPEKVTRAYRDLADSIEYLINKLNPNIVTTREAEAANKSAAATVQESIKHHQKYSEGLAAGIRILSERAEKEKKLKEAITDVNKALSGETEDLLRQTYNLTMEESSYYEWLKGTLLLKGAHVKIVNEWIAAQKALNEVQKEAKAEPVDYSKVALNVPDYSASDKARADFNAQLIAERNASANALAELERNSPYKGDGGQLGAAYSTAYGEKYQAELQAMQEFNTKKLQLMVDAGATQYQIEQEYERMTTAMKQQEYQLRLGAAANFAGGMANFFQNLYVASGKNSRKLFEIGKAFAIAEAIMNTAKAATMALSAPPGPPVSFAYVAAAIAAGAAQIATISSTQPGGGSISASGSASPSYSGGSPSAYPMPQRLEPESRGAVTEPKIEINIYHPWGNEDWDEIMEEKIMPAYNRAKARNL